MNILVLGGTGAMGVPLVNSLSKNNQVYVTTRSKHQSSDSVHYIQGNATDKKFLEKTLSLRHWNAIVDFMIHSEALWREILPSFLNATDQYVFISSARVYSQSDELITEETPRLLDICKDKEYLKTNEYALAKAREENLLRDSGRNNWTIIRPSITYNTHRLQLGVFEINNWLYRVLHSRSIVFSEDIIDKLTTMTLGNDVSLGIASVIGKTEALGEAFHITYPSSLRWSEVLGIYLKVLKQRGINPKVVLTKKSTNLKFKAKIYQVIYCRYFNRTFDNSKIARFCNISEFTPPQEGLAQCLNNFLDNPKFGNIDWVLEAVNDRAAGERTPLKEIPSLINKLDYLFYRNGLAPLSRIMHWCERALHKLKRLLTGGGKWLIYSELQGGRIALNKPNSCVWQYNFKAV